MEEFNINELDWKEMDVVVNRLPARTWNHLHVNETTVKSVKVEKKGSLQVISPETDLFGQEGILSNMFSEIETGVGRDLEKLAASVKVTPDIFVADAAYSSQDSVHFQFSYENGDHAINLVGLETKENAKLTVIMDYRSDKKSEGLAAVQTKLYAGKHSQIRLVQIQRVGEGFTFFNDIGGFCEEGAEIELIQLILSGNQSYTGCQMLLKGDESKMSANIGYAVCGQDKLDMNYVVRHLGKKSQCDITALGSLRNQAKKVFRGTIDFVNGSSGSVGNEKEEVLLIDESTVNQTVPLILCAEEDVVGNHGATIGRPDEEVLFYLSSRGISMEEAYNMLSRAKLDAVSAKIPDETVRKEVQEYIKGGSLDE